MNEPVFRSSLLALAALAIVSNPVCAQGAPQAAARLARALAAPSVAELRADVQFLADDLLGGRAPGTPGGEIAARFIAARFQALGLEPAGDDGTYFQRFGLVALEPRASFVVGGQGRTASLEPETDFVAWSERSEEATTVDGDLVFVGYGIDAPEWGWDDYKDVPVAGRILVLLVGDPGLEDTTRFRGKRPTYYGSVTYKLQQAARVGARGAVLIHRDGDAPMSWRATVHTWGGERVRPPAPGTTTLRVGAWITEDATKRITDAAGRNFDLLARRAAQPSFQPIPLGAHGVITLRNRIRETSSANVVAMLRGADSLASSDVVVVSAHYDHLGIGIAEGNDSVYNGAEDNASGSAALLGVARGLVAGGPRRSVLFLATTATESGRLGADEFLRHTAIPAVRMVAVVNIDRANLRGRVQDVMGLGADESTLQDVLRQAATAEGMTVTAPAPGSVAEVYHLDPLPFAMAGIPGLTLRAGLSYRDRVESWGAEREAEYLANRFHRPSDAVEQETLYDGLPEQVRVAVRLIWALATADTYPKWKPDAEFRAAGERLELRRLRAAPPRRSR
jgi:Zn-dependent M28 family amino/carboxypeptidase